MCDCIPWGQNGHISISLKKEDSFMKNTNLGKTICMIMSVKPKPKVPQKRRPNICHANASRSTSQRKIKTPKNADKRPVQKRRMICTAL